MNAPMTVRWGVGLAAVTAVISGLSVYLNGRLVGSFDDPTALAAVRNGLVGLVLVAVAARVGSLRVVPSLGRRERVGLLAIGIIGGGIPFALFFNGLALSTSPAAALIHKTLFVWVAVLAIPLLGERLGFAQVGAMVLLLIGTLVVAPTGALGLGVGEAMILAATLLWAVEVVIARALLRDRVPSSLAAAARMTIGSITLLALVGATGGLGGIAAWTADQWLAILVTGLLLAGYVSTWYAALKRAPAAIVSSVLVVGAVITAGLAALTSGNLPAATALAGNAFLLAGGLLAIAAVRAMRPPRMEPAA